MVSRKGALLAQALALLGHSRHVRAKGEIPAFTGTPKGSKTQLGSPIVSVNAGVALTSYIVMMEGKPIVARDDSGGDDPAHPAPGEKDPNSEEVKNYKTLLEEEQAMAAESVGTSIINQYTFVLNGFSAFMTSKQAEKLRGQEGVSQVVLDELRQMTTDGTPDMLGLTNPGGAWAAEVTGEDVVVGIIDSGIWPEHPSFADDGSYGELPGYEDVPCEFGDVDHNENDAPFECNNKLLGARQFTSSYHMSNPITSEEFNSTRDDDGHGSHIASTAAGNAGVAAEIQGASIAGADVIGLGRANAIGGISGVAPRARIIAYKACGLECALSDLVGAIDQSVADGVDVINYSIGSAGVNFGPDDISFLFAERAGVWVATSAGNSGPGASTVGSPAWIPWLTSVGASTQSREFQASAKSSDGWEVFGASVAAGTEELPLIDSTEAGNELCYPSDQANFTQDIQGKIVLCLRGEIARVDKSLAVAEAGGLGMILMNPNDGDSLDSGVHSVPTVHISNSDGLIIKNYIATSPEPVAQISPTSKTYVASPSMAAFSSRGPNAGALDIIKPDITAPGVNILAATTPFPAGGDVQGVVKGQFFTFLSGTSMSSPHIAGVFALLKQAHPDYTPSMAKSAIMTTAHQAVTKEDGTTAADPFDFGAGHVSIGSVSKGSPFQPGLVYEAGFFEYIGFLCGIELYPFGTFICQGLESNGVPTTAVDLNYPSVAASSIAGSIVVKRTVTSVANGAVEYNAIIEAPQGADVWVSPSSISLTYGESASYEIHIARSAATTDEWLSGSLSWVSPDAEYQVRSPIAVRFTLLDFPQEMVSAGVDGSASLDIVFGYNGPYLAAGHGLVPAQVTTGSVIQDPDQEFDPIDGYSTLHTFIVSGAAHLRFALPPDSVADPDIDLDMYLFGPDLHLVDLSTNIGTDEQIDVALPADGTWYLFVHGWYTAGESADYNLYSWTVSATPGGNLAIGDSPNSATTGSQGSVDISWDDASAGEWHLGAVSHTGNDGLLGLTLVDVDNRAELI